ncbi:MAG: (Fe-S)-binding protein [Proteobacteria bacterium]|nr:(Fe-S)-binding protein [Pseudomonadota bacterium]
MKDLESFRPEIDKCVKCGTCRSICPTTRVLARESACARGKLTLIKAYLDGEIEMSENYMRHIKECAMCGGCRDVCPAGVKTTDVYLAARAAMVEKKGLPFLASLVFKNLDSTRLMPFALKLGTRFKSLFFKGAETDTGLVSRFSLPMVGGGRLMPEVAGKFFLDMKEARKLGKRVKPKADDDSDGSPRVAFFAGCGVNYLMPQVGTASIKCIERTGATVSVPRAQVCCGMPAFYTGDIETATRLAKKNIELFETYGADYIATSCATCSHGLKTVFKKLFEDDDEMRERAEAFSSKVRDITELLARDLGPMKSMEESGEKSLEKSGELSVTYHDPCHLNRNQGIKAEPRALLEAAPGVKFRNMKFACSCCGLGGGLSMTNYDLSIAITKRKTDGALRSGADVVATACPGCIVQLRDAMHHYGVDKKVVHVVELL